MTDTKPPPDVENPARAGIHQHVRLATSSGGTEEHRGKGSRFTVPGEKGVDREIGEDVPVVEQEGRLTKGAARVADASPGIQQERLMEDPQRTAAVAGFVAKDPGKGPGKMMRVEDERPDPGRNQAVEGVGQERLVKDRNQWLRQEIRQRAQPCSEARREDKSGGGAHAVAFVSTRRRIESAAKAAPNPLSMFTTVTPLAQLLTMPSSAVSPWKCAP